MKNDFGDGAGEKGAEIMNRLTALRRADNLRKRHRKKEWPRSNFFKGPFKLVKSRLTQDKSEKLKTSKKAEAQLEKNPHKTALPPDMSPLHLPEHQVDVSLPKWSEGERTVRRTRATFSPGPNLGWTHRDITIWFKLVCCLHILKPRDRLHGNCLVGFWNQTWHFFKPDVCIFMRGTGGVERGAG